MPYPHALNVIGDATPTALIEGLSALDRHIITFDPPGGGRSTRAMQLTMQEMLVCGEGALAACGIDGPVDVLGHSQGGVAALAFTLERSERVSCLILVCTASGGPAYLHAPGAIWNRSHPAHRRMMLRAALYWATRSSAAERRMLDVIFRASWVDRSRFQPKPASLSEWFRPAGRRTWWNQVARGIDFRLRLDEVHVPTLVMAGRFDPQMPPACSGELAAGITGAQLVVFERSGHYPFMEEPELFWCVVHDFLARTAETRRAGMDT